MPNKALLLVDFENEWNRPDSDYYIGDVSDLINKTNQLIDFCRKKNYKIIFTTHIEAASKAEFAPNSKNIEIIPAIHRQPEDVLISKNKISPFYKTNLEKELSGIKEIVVAGILTNLCVRSTVQDAYDRDFDIKVITDCCMAFDQETHNFTIKDIKATREEVEFLNLKKFIK